jgi:hypothetical protein
MKRTMLSACLLTTLVVVGCKSETGTVLQIANTPAFEDDCSLSASPTAFQGQGFYDPAGGGGYVLPLTIVNNASSEEDTARPAANDVNIVGFDFCFYSAADENVTGYCPKGEGLLVECDDLPDSQRAFFPRGGGVDSGGGTMVGGFTTLDAANLRAIFGETFSPTTIPPGDDPTNAATRSAGWGDFPSDNSATVVINIRMRARAQDGDTMRSNWYAFPVIVVPTSVRDACGGDFVNVICDDGSAGQIGTAFPDGVCGAIFSGAAFACVTVNTCA